MRQKLTWVHFVTAALLVLGGGLGLAFAETYNLEVRQEDGEKVTVVVNDATEVLTLDKLADGESRTFGEGEGKVTVRREGDTLMVDVDGSPIEGIDSGHADHSMVWVTTDKELTIETEGEEGEHGKDCAKKVKKVFVQRAGDDDTWVQDDGQTYRIEVRTDDEDGDDVLFVDGSGAKHEVIELKGASGDELQARIAELKAKGIEIGGDGMHRMLVTARGDLDKVRYRCDDGDEELLVAKELATADSYVSPVSGCVMKKAEHPKVKVITVVKKVEENDIDDHDTPDSHED